MSDPIKAAFIAEKEAMIRRQATEVAALSAKYAAATQTLNAVAALHGMAIEVAFRSMMRGLEPVERAAGGGDE